MIERLSPNGGPGRYRIAVGERVHEVEARSLGAFVKSLLVDGESHETAVWRTRDGAWLLQVERHAHDVVLDRLPWSWGLAQAALDARSPAGGVVMRADDVIAANLGDLEQELAWFTRLVDFRLRRYFPSPEAGPDARAASPELDVPDGTPPPPELGRTSSVWAAFLREHPRTFAKRAALVLALVPHLRPRLLDVFFTKNAVFDRRFTEFGGIRADDDFEPTGETLAFLLGGDGLSARMTVARLLEPDHPLLATDVLRLGAAGRERKHAAIKARLSGSQNNYINWSM